MAHNRTVKPEYVTRAGNQGPAAILERPELAAMMMHILAIYTRGELDLCDVLWVLLGRGAVQEFEERLQLRQAKTRKLALLKRLETRFGTDEAKLFTRLLRQFDRVGREIRHPIAHGVWATGAPADALLYLSADEFTKGEAHWIGGPRPLPERRWRVYRKADFQAMTVDAQVMVDGIFRYVSRAKTLTHWPAGR